MNLIHTGSAQSVLFGENKSMRPSGWHEDRQENVLCLALLNVNHKDLNLIIQLGYLTSGYSSVTRILKTNHKQEEPNLFNVHYLF